MTGSRTGSYHRSMLSQMTPVRSKRDTLVHVTSLTTPARTACGIKCNGWLIAPVRKSHVGCVRCKAAIHIKVLPKRSR